MSQSEIQEVKVSLAEVKKDVRYTDEKVTKTLEAIEKCTKSMQELSDKFSTYTTKHDEAQKDIEEIRIKQDHQDKEIQEMRLNNQAVEHKLSERIGSIEPTTDLVKTLFQRMIIGLITGIAGISTVVIALFQYVIAK